MVLRRRLRSETGETLVELIVAVAILGLAAVAILAGMQLSVKASDIQRKEATGGAQVRSFAEAIQDYVDTVGYRPCGSAKNDYQAVAAPPTGYTASVESVQSWTGTAWGTCDDSSGTQRLDLKVTSPGNPSRRSEETLTVILREPCNAEGDNPCD
jgi:type II secretory pathway pseudopilin PulG